MFFLKISLSNQVFPPPPDITASPLGEQICPDNLVIWMDLIHLFEGTKALMANYLGEVQIHVQGPS